MSTAEGKQWVADVDLSVWRKKKTVDNMRRAFISSVNCGECPPDDLLQAVAVWFYSHPKKLPAFKFTEADLRYSNIKRTMEQRGDGVTKEDIYEIYAKKWDIDYDSVERSYQRWKSGKTPVNLIETSTPYQKRPPVREIPEEDRHCGNCDYWIRGRCFLINGEPVLTSVDHSCGEGLHLEELK